MYRCRPGKWILPALAAAGLPWLAAGLFNTDSLKSEVSSRAAAAVGGDWAKLAFDGRDVTLTGTAASEDIKKAALEAVQKTYGVRLVDSSGVNVVPPKPPVAPTLVSVAADPAAPVIKGTWPEEKGAKLSATLLDKTYDLGSPELTSDGKGNFTFSPKVDLKPGSYDVNFLVTSAAGLATPLLAAAAIVIPEPPKKEEPKPVEPAKLEPLTLAAVPPDSIWPYALKGHWPEGPANALSLTLDGKTYELGKTQQLISDGHGAFTFVPNADLQPGTYDITALATAADGRNVSTTFPAAIVVKAPEPAPPKPPVAPLPAPEIGKQTIQSGMAAMLEGSWPEAQAKGLSLKLEGRIYELGETDELKSDGKGHFTFMPKVELAPGKHDVEVQVIGKDGKATTTPFAEAITVAQPPPAPPKLGNQTIPSGTAAMLQGDWPEGAAKGLILKLEGKTYELGKSEELTSDGKGHFMFMPKEQLKPGKHDVEVQVTAKDGKATTTPFVSAITVAEPPPRPLTAATVDQKVIDSGKPVVLTGTWPVGTARTLAVMVNGGTYRLGKDFELLSDTAGKWTLKPKGAFAPGKYDVIAQVGDGAGRTLDDATAGELTINALPPPPPKPLTAASVDAITIEVGKPVVLTGKWPVGVAKSLAVTAGGRTYTLGKDVELLSDTAGKWMLKPKAEFKAGRYDVTAQVGDGAGKTLDDSSSGELTVTAPPPPPPKPLPPPTVEDSTSDSDHPVVKGTWPVGVAKTLQVELDGVTHTLGKDFDLLSDTAGKWTLRPAKPVVNGTYDVIAKVMDGSGQAAFDSSKNELTVTVAAPPPPPPANQPYDCEGTLARIAAVFPIRFEFDHDGLVAPYSLSVSQYAALLKDPRCASLKLQVAGHADYFGSERYNQGLSERRAQTVVDMMSKAGIDASRLSPVGFSKDKPLDPEKSEGARAKNRRVEFSVVK